MLMDYMIKYSRDYVKMNREARENKMLRAENEYLNNELQKLRSKYEV